MTYSQFVPRSGFLVDAAHIMGGKAGREFCPAGVPVMLATAYAQHVQALGLGQIVDDAVDGDKAPRKRGRPAKGGAAADAVQASRPDIETDAAGGEATGDQTDEA